MIARTRLVSLALVALMTALGAAGLLAVQQKPAAAPSAEALLGQALHQEQGQGRLEDAIVTYRKVVAAPDASRDQKARAQLRIGACYERLGMSEAKKAYEAALQYGELPDVVKEARARLAALAAPASPRTTGQVLRSLWKGMNVNTWGSVSPDGRMMAYRDPIVKALVIRSVETGELRTIVADERNDVVDPVAWSPDGKTIAYVRWPNGPQEIRTMPATGGPSKTIYTAAEKDDFASPLQWMPDGRSVVALTIVGQYGGGQRVYGLVEARVDDGSSRLIATLDSPRVDNIRLSPDGKFIAYEHRKGYDYGVVSVAVMPASGGPSRPLRESADDARLVGWSPNGRGIVTARVRAGADALWVQPVIDGAPQGEPALVREAIGPGGMWQQAQVLADGSIVFATRGTRSDVYVATVDFDAGRIVDEPRSLSARLGGNHASASWSPDGRTLAFLSGAGRLQAGTATLVDAVTSRPRQLSLPFGVVFGNNPPRWSRDGSSFFSDVRAASTQEKGLYRIDAATGTMTLVTPISQAGEPLLAVPDADETHVYFAARAKDAPVDRIMSIMSKDMVSSIYSKDIRSGEVVELYRHHKGSYITSPLSISPDGKSIAFSNTIHPDNSPTGKAQSFVHVLDLATASSREVLRIDDISTRNLAWSSDQKFLVVAIWRSGTDGELCRVSISDRSVTTIPLPGRAGMSLHPDNRRIAYEIQSNGPNEILLLENALPANMLGKPKGGK